MFLKQFFKIGKISKIIKIVNYFIKIEQKIELLIIDEFSKQ